MFILGNKIICTKCIYIEQLLCAKAVYYIKSLWKTDLHIFRFKLMKEDRTHNGIRNR